MPESDAEDKRHLVPAWTEVETEAPITAIPEPAPSLDHHPAEEAQRGPEPFADPGATRPRRRIAAPAWLQQVLRSTEFKTEPETLPTAQAAEATGVLAGLTTLMRPERLTGAVVVDRPETLLTAAREFQAIAAQPPQPATLPGALTEPKSLLSNIPRSMLYLLFLLLVAVPLMPNLRAVDAGRETPWTEPGGEFSEELDRQRRFLVSEELGVIDLQPPEAVALVSFDFTPAGQGEMQPLAEAIIGRLLGQGMRVLFVSLEPEGANLAQQTINRLLHERNEAYGQNLLNLGYVPGQVMGVRSLVSEENSLAMLEDFQEKLTLASPERSSWQSLKNLGQVDLIVTITDSPVIARWWIEQMEFARPPDDGERFLLAATSAMVSPFVQPYRASRQIDGLIAGINGAAAIEAGRREFGPARQMLDSQSIAHLLLVILIAAGTIVGWMPVVQPESTATSTDHTDPAHSQNGTSL